MILCLKALSREAPLKMHLEPNAQSAVPLQEYAAAEERSAGIKGSAIASSSSKDCGLDLGPLGNFLLGRCVR